MSINYGWGNKMKSLLVMALALSVTTAALARSHSYTYHSHSHRTAYSYGERDLATNNHYVNVSGHYVHSPSQTFSGARPAGASAHCNDGSWSFSEHARGTCSHHGGVASW